MRRVLSGLVGCLCAPLVVGVQSAFAVTVTAGTISSVEGAQFKGQVASFSDIIGLAGCQAISSYTSTVAWGDDHTTSAATVGTPQANGLSCVYPVSAQHEFKSVGNGQAFTVSVSGALGSGTGTGSANVTAAPLSSVPEQLAETEGEAFTATVANFTDGFPGRPASRYTATVDWGDGSPASAATVGPVADGSFNVDASHTYANVGTYTTTVMISDPEGSHTTAVGSTTVADAPLGSTGLTNTAIEGAPFVARLATFTDADPGRPASHYSATVSWGDGSSTTSPEIVADPGGGFDVYAGHTYANPGFYTTSVTISDGDGSQTTAVGTTTVADAPLSSTGLPTSGVAGAAIGGIVATFTDGDPGRSASYYSAVIDWGDGSSTTGQITADPAGGFDVSGTHTYASAGSYPTTVAISDPGGSQTIATSTASVAAPPPPPPPPVVVPTPTPVPDATTPAPAAVVAPASAKPAVAKVLPTPKLGLTSPRLSAAGTSISIGVSCPSGGASCQGVVRLTTLPAAKSKIATLRRGATIGSVLFVLHPDQSKTFSVHIASATLRLLREAGTARVQGVAIAFGQTGNATSSGAVAKIAAAKAR